MANMFLVCAFVINFMIFIKAMSIPEESQLDQFIKERKLREAGFTHFELTTIEHHRDEDMQSLDAASIHRRRRSVVNNDDFYHVKIPAFGELYEMKLSHSKSVLHPSATIVTINGETETPFEGQHPDCYLTGDVHSHDGIVSASFCYELNGMIGTPTHELHFEVLPQYIRKRSTGRHSAVISRKTRESLLEPLMLDNDYIIVEETDIKENRQKRAVPSTDFEIEMAVYCDSDFLTYDLTTTDPVKRVDNMLVKYNGVQFEWARSDQLNYNVTISIKYMAFFDTNPLWYNTSSSLGVPLSNICLGTTATKFDHIHMHTGVPSPALGGLAWQNNVCNPTYRCGVSADGVTTYVTTAHELGHNMGMYHDSDKGCVAPNVGVMGGAGVGWSTCSRDDMNTRLQTGSADCLWTDDIPNNEVSPAPLQGLVLDPGIPGQKYSADELCEFKYGTGWRYREFPHVVPTSCNIYSCVDTNRGPLYGRMNKETSSINGLYCADNMICFDGSCQGFSAAQITDPLIRPGNWSEWSEWTGCSRTCGRGINYRRRKCNNPSPINTADCDGNEFDAIACNTTPCTGDSGITSTLINQRASETCQRLIDNGVINGTMFSAVGSIYSSLNWGDCEVECAPNAGYTAPSLHRYGLIEDGTPCSGSLSTSDANLYPRRPGYYYACMEGYCEKFDCNDTTGTLEFDSCGVCNGDSSTCLVREGTFTQTLAQWTRSEWTEIPVGAFNIEISYTWNDMKQYYIEIHTKDGTPIIASNIVGDSRIFDTGNNPVSYGGTFWHFKYLTQIMHAQGPLTEPVIVKIYNLKTNANTGIKYIYSVPLDIDSCLGTCDNCGTWNNRTCAYNCSDGFYGPNCTSQCSTLCKNGASVNETTCGCECNEKQYGDKCECRHAYTGENCEMCKVGTCENCGTFNISTCRCDCLPGYGGLQCESTCADKDDSSACSERVASGDCINDNVYMEENCMASCGLCTVQCPPATCSQPSRPGVVSSVCSCDKFTCVDDSGCIDLSKVNDGVDDCTDSSDETTGLAGGQSSGSGLTAGLIVAIIIGVIATIIAAVSGGILIKRKLSSSITSKTAIFPSSPQGNGAPPAKTAFPENNSVTNQLQKKTFINSVSQTYSPPPMYQEKITNVGSSI